MNTGQTIITMGALIILSLTLTNFYNTLARSGTTLGVSEAGISQISLAASYFERAQGLAFDVATSDTFVTDTSALTSMNNLGVEAMHIRQVDSASYDTVRNTASVINTFDDFDDFNGAEIDDTALASSLGRFHTSFAVYYVKPDSIDKKATTRTFTKRLDMKIWRTYPPSTDTLRQSKVLGYFHFD